jgi:hypothetical protein
MIDGASNIVLERTAGLHALAAAAQRGRSPNIAAGRADLGKEPGGHGATFTFTLPVHRGE